MSQIIQSDRSLPFHPHSQLCYSAPVLCNGLDIKYSPTQLYSLKTLAKQPFSFLPGLVLCFIFPPSHINKLHQISREKRNNKKTPSPKIIRGKKKKKAVGAHSYGQNNTRTHSFTTGNPSNYLSLFVLTLPQVRTKVILLSKFSYDI